MNILFQFNKLEEYIYFLFKAIFNRIVKIIGIQNQLPILGTALVCNKI